MRKVIAWSVNIVWSDGVEETTVDAPDYVAREVDGWMDSLEEMVNEELTEEDEE